MILAGTGHRLQHFSGCPMVVEQRLDDLCVAALKKWKPDKVISGMALGFDLALARAALYEGIPLVAAIPYYGQHLKWKPAVQDYYVGIKNRASEVVIVSPGKLTEYWEFAAALQKRNEYMVDHCDKILALFSGAKGGTANCVKYANKVGKPVINLWESWLKYSGV